MPRWRDVKHKKVSKKIKIEKEKRFSYAKISDRLKAFLTDTFMITMPILYIVIYFVMGSREEFKAHMTMGWIYILFPHFLIVLSFWALKRQTPGMRAYDIEILKKDLKRPDILQLILRYVFMQISIISIIGILIAFFRKDRQTLHDLLSFTIMVEKKREKS